MEDLDAATLDDVCAFFERWYGAGNATLAIGGDFEPGRALQWVERYFGTIPRGPAVSRPRPRPSKLRNERRLVLEDRVAQPQLSLAWPTVEAWHPDEPALNLLADLLSANRSSILDKALQVEEKLATHVTILHAASERAGHLVVGLRPHGGVELEDLLRRTDELLHELASEGVDAERLERLKNRMEGAMVRGLETLGARTSRLASYNCLFGDPDLLERDLERHRRVEAGDLHDVLERYLVGRPRILLSVVPRGQGERALPSVPEAPEPTPEEPDRSRAPESGELPRFAPPALWKRTLASGLRVAGNPCRKLPLDTLGLAVPAGRAHVPVERAGLASLCAQMLQEGTLRRSGPEWTDALDGLGGSLGVGSGVDDVELALSVLDRHAEQALELLAELVLEPRFDAGDFERLRRERLVAIGTREDRIAEIADDLFVAAVHGPASPRGSFRLGTRESIEALTVEELAAYWRRRLGSDRSRLVYVGATGSQDFEGFLGRLAHPWSDATGAHEAGDAREGASAGRGAFEPGIYLVDKPGATQSQLRVGHLGVASDDPDFYPLQALNVLIAGGFVSRLNLNLREDKGYTYGVHSAFSGGLAPGLFQVATAVEGQHTAAALGEILRELERLGEGVTEQELDFVRRNLGQSLLGTYASTGARLSLLHNVLKYGYPEDYPLRRLQWLEGMQASDLDGLVARHVDPAALVAVVVGDRERVLGGLEELAGGSLVELDARGQPRGLA
jgi:zinc protease